MKRQILIILALLAGAALFYGYRMRQDRAENVVVQNYPSLHDFP